LAARSGHRKDHATVQQHHAYVLPALLFSWLGEPLSINRPLGVSALGSGLNGTATLAATYYAVVCGRSPTAQANALPYSRRPARWWHSKLAGF
jgi:hypothetical protein